MLQRNIGHWLCRLHYLPNIWHTYLSIITFLSLSRSSYISEPEMFHYLNAQLFSPLMTDSATFLQELFRLFRNTALPQRSTWLPPLSTAQAVGWKMKERVCVRC